MKTTPCAEHAITDIGSKDIMCLEVYIPEAGIRLEYLKFLGSLQHMEQCSSFSKTHAFTCFPRPKTTVLRLLFKSCC